MQECSIQTSLFWFLLNKNRACVYSSPAGEKLNNQDAVNKGMMLACCQMKTEDILIHNIKVTGNVYQCFCVCVFFCFICGFSQLPVSGVFYYSLDVIGKENNFYGFE